MSFSANYNSAKWRSGADDFRTSSTLNKLDDELTYANRSTGNSDPYNLDQHLGLQSSVKLKHHDPLSSRNASLSHDRLSREDLQYSKYNRYDAGENMNFSLKPLDQSYAKSPRSEKASRSGDQLSSSDLISSRGRSALDHYTRPGSNLSRISPRNDIGDVPARGQRSVKEVGDDVSFRDNASLRSSVRFSDEVDRKLYSFDKDGLHSNSVLPPSSFSDRISEKSFPKSSLSSNKAGETSHRSGDLSSDRRYDRLTNIAEDRHSSDRADTSPRPGSSRSSLILRDDHLGRLTALDEGEARSLESRLLSSSSQRSSSSGILKKHGKLSRDLVQDPTIQETDHNMHLKSRSGLTESESLKRTISLRNDALQTRSSGGSSLLSHSSRDVNDERDRSLKLNFDDHLVDFHNSRKTRTSPRSRETSFRQELDHFDHLDDRASHVKSPHMSRSRSGESEQTPHEKEAHLSSKSQNLVRLGKVLDKDITSTLTLDRGRNGNTFQDDLLDFENRGRLRNGSDSREFDSSHYKSGYHEINSSREALLREGEGDRRQLHESDHDLNHRSRKLNFELGSKERKGVDGDNLLDMSSNSQDYGNQRRAHLLDDPSRTRISDKEFKEFKDSYGDKNLRSRGSSLSEERSRSRQQSRLFADVTGAKYKIVKHMIKMAGFTIATSKDTKCDLIWNDSFVSLEKISELQSCQRINHFAGMGEICRLESLVKIISRMSSRHQGEYSFFPKSWVCPDDTEAFQTHCKDLKKKGKKMMYIVKPIKKSKADGISLCLDPEKVPVNNRVVIQEYIDQPLLINKRKFHVRCFVLVTSCDPPRIFLFSDGLVFLASDPYVEGNESNCDHISSHISSEAGEKCSLRGLLEKLHQGGVNVDVLWKAINDIIIKTLILVHPHLYQNYKLCRALKDKAERESVCFEILGFDFLVDRDMKPWLLKVNQSPSFNTSDNLELELKSGVLEDALQLVTLGLQPTIPVKMNLAMAEEALTKLNGSTKAGPKTNEKSKKDEKVMSEEDSKKQEIIRIIDGIYSEAKAHRFGNNSGRFKQIFPHYDKNSLEKYSKLFDSAHIFISGPDEKRKQEVTQFLTQKEKDRLQAIIRSNRIANGGQGSSNGQNIILVDLGPELTEKTLTALNSTHLTVPGKTEKATEALLVKLHNNWKSQKPKLAKFWFIHLDSNKREKVINIVKNKVRSVASHTWSTSDLENVRLYRTFHRLFNRLLANHGRALWDCFSPRRNKSWETIFVKGTSAITPTELSCCQRITQLCCHCVCIAYICTPEQE